MHAVEDLDGVLIAFEVDRKISTRREFAEPDIVRSKLIFDDWEFIIYFSINCDIIMIALLQASH